MITKNIILAPFKNFSKFLVGFVLFVLSELIIPPIFAFGYIIRVYQNSQNKEFSMPEWKNWLDLGKKGLIAALIIIVYFIPTFALFFISILSFTIQIDLVGYVLIFLAILLALISLFIMPTVFFQYSKNEKILEAFNFTVIFGLLKNNLIKHSMLWGLLILINLPFFIINIVLRTLLGEGILLGVLLTILFAFSQFFILIVMAMSFTRLYAGIKEKVSTTDKKSDDTGKEHQEQKKEDIKRQKSAETIDKKFCSDCGTELKTEDKFCNKCGAKL